MKIGKNNYEEYMIDFIEGNLSPEMYQEMEAFLDSNPEIKEELYGFDMAYIDPEPTEFKAKSALKVSEINPFKSINEENYEDWFISFYEKNLSLEEKEDLTAFLHLNPFLNKEFEDFSKVYLEKEKVVYPNKAKLKRSQPKIIQFSTYVTIGIAASLILFFGIQFLNENNKDLQMGQLAHLPILNDSSIQIHQESKEVDLKDLISLDKHSKKLISSYKEKDFEPVIKQTNFKQLAMRKNEIKNFYITDQYAFVEYRYEYLIRINNLEFAEELEYNRKQKKKFFGRIIENIVSLGKKNSQSKSYKFFNENQGILNFIPNHLFSKADNNTDAAESVMKKHKAVNVGRKRRFNKN
ncbi:MAG: hypothetical protein ACEPOV_07540 [Hyphomicrobiales bacterium]